MRPELFSFAACRVGANFVGLLAASSNILGQHTPICEVVDLVARLSEGKAKTVLDCVAYAPHALLDVQAWGVDFMAFSYYSALCRSLVQSAIASRLG